MITTNYRRELAEMKDLWQQESERETIHQFLQAYYIMRGWSPKATGDFFHYLPDDELSRIFDNVMDESRKRKSPIDLLGLLPVRVV